MKSENYMLLLTSLVLLTILVFLSSARSFDVTTYAAEYEETQETSETSEASENDEPPMEIEPPDLVVDDAAESNIDNTFDSFESSMESLPDESQGVIPSYEDGLYDSADYVPDDASVLLEIRDILYTFYWFMITGISVGIVVFILKIVYPLFRGY